MACGAMMAAVLAAAAVSERRAALLREAMHAKMERQHAYADEAFAATRDLAHALAHTPACSAGIDLPAYWINLDESTARRARFVKGARRAGLDPAAMTRVPAARGDDFWHDAAVHSGFAWRSKGELGCALSHMRAARALLEDGHEAALVLEDDADLSFWPLWPHSLAELVAALPPRWTTLSLHHWDRSGQLKHAAQTLSGRCSVKRILKRDFDEASVGAIEREGEGGGPLTHWGERVANTSVFVLSTSHTKQELWGTTAYIISRRWARALCAATDGCTALRRDAIPLETNKTGSDHLLYQMAGHDAYVVWPQYVQVAPSARVAFSTVTQHAKRAARDRARLAALADDNARALARLRHRPPERVGVVGAGGAHRVVTVAPPHATRVSPLVLFDEYDADGDANGTATGRGATRPRSAAGRAAHAATIALATVLSMLVPAVRAMLLAAMPDPGAHRARARERALADTCFGGASARAKAHVSWPPRTCEPLRGHALAAVAAILARREPRHHRSRRRRSRRRE